MISIKMTYYSLLFKGSSRVDREFLGLPEFAKKITPKSAEIWKAVACRFTCSDALLNSVSGTVKNPTKISF